MEAQGIRTRRADDARQRIEAAIARRKDEFALSHVVWTADYGYVVKFHSGAVEVVRTAVEMLVFDESWRMDRMLHGVRLTFKALAPQPRHARDAAYAVERRANASDDDAEPGMPEASVSVVQDSTRFTLTRSSRPQSPLGRRAARFWLPIVDPLFHGSFGRRLARNSFEPYGLVATAIRVSPPYGQEIPSIEANPDPVLEAVIFLHASFLQPLDPGRMVTMSSDIE